MSKKLFIYIYILDNNNGNHSIIKLYFFYKINCLSDLFLFKDLLEEEIKEIRIKIAEAKLKQCQKEAA